MALQSLVVVGIRLIALWFGAQALLAVPIVISTIADSISGEIFSDSLRTRSIWEGLVFLAQIITALLLWMLAPLLALLAIRGAKGDLPMLQLTLTDCYTVGFVSIGAWYVIKHLSSGLTWAHYLFIRAVSTSGTSWREGINWYDVATVFLTLVFGMVLIVYGRKWAGLLAQRQQHAEAANQTGMPASAAPANQETK